LYYIFLGAKFKRHASITLPLFRRAKVITNLDVIVNCADKLLAIWRTRLNQHVHLDIVQQCQNLLLDIFGLIAFDYDLETLNDDGGSDNKELTKALHDFVSTFEKIVFAPSFVGTIYAKLNRRHRQARAIIDRHLYQMIEQELAQSAESITQRKRTCLIASLVASMQEDEQLEATKSEEEKKGKKILE
jgi:cytochrome P450